jgi:hypothetical protein
MREYFLPLDQEGNPILPLVAMVMDIFMGHTENLQYVRKHT